MKNAQKYLSSFLLAALVLQGTVFFSLPAEALFGVSIPSPSQAADQIEKRYNLDLNSLREQGQNLNVLDNKQPSPEVSLVFDPTDPRPGQRLTAKAFPLYFNGPQEQMYYTWYLKRAGCDLGAVRDSNRFCNEDGNGRITVEDWKIAAMREIAASGFDNEEAASQDTDNDGYQARFGGSARAGVPNHCYYHDPTSGEDYEIATGVSDGSFTCPDGRDPVCVVSDQILESDEISSELETSEGTACYVAGYPICSRSGNVSCSTGTPACINRDVANDCGTSLTECSVEAAESVNPVCRHLFPNAPGEESGDGSFGLEEERFWRTNPADPSTADNGNKDEANIVGLGRTDFSWNYAAGDSVGVVVEGNSLFPSKHDDASYKIMWAMAKNDCPISLARGVGSYTKNVKNYQVTFPAVNIDLNDCLERNLVDPTQGGQSTNLDVQMVTSPENPVNDETEDKSGDTVVAQTIVNNGQKGPSNQLFEWKVEISNNQQFNNTVGRVADITNALVGAGLLRQTSGTGLDTLEIDLNMARTLQLAGRPLTDYLLGEQGYLRITSRVSENFASGIVRKGTTNAIVPFTSTRNKIIAYKASPVLVGDRMRVQLPDSGGIICQDARLDRAICRVVQNEIIGMKIDATGLDNFQWSINNTPLSCFSNNVSPDCGANQPNEINFFPANGEVGSSYTVSVTANDIETGKTVSLSRLFQVVEPTVAIVSADPAVVAPKFLGQYRDIRGESGGCPGGICDNYSKAVFQGYSGSVLKLKTLFIPSFLSRTSQIEWSVDNQVVETENPNEISIDTADTPPGRIVNITVRALTKQDDDTRRALVDTWDISQLDSEEERFESSIQIELLEEESDGEVAGIRKYFAALGTYLPETFLYTLRMLLSGGLVLFVAGAAFVFLPEAPALSRTRREEE